ncbi:MAG: single-stranded DNA-binding protein [Patescibacteria group bacterium]
MARSVNKVILVGNLTRDPELRYTPQGHAVVGFGVATNREWKSEGEKKESTEFHNIVAWNKLAELCSQLLTKGTKVYVEGRLQTRDWVNDSGEKRYKTEVVIEEMIVLSSRKDDEDGDSHPVSDSHASPSDAQEDDLGDIEDFLNAED